MITPLSIMILDDAAGRHDNYKKYLTGHTLHHFYDAAAALEFIQSNRVDVMLLDHDLGEGRPTGYDFLKALYNAKYNRATGVVIHSMNPSGAGNMMSFAQLMFGENVVCWPGLFCKMPGLVRRVVENVKP